MASERCYACGGFFSQKNKDFIESNLKGVKEGRRGILVEFNGVENCLKMADIPAKLKGLFDSYADIFQSSMHLPPQRAHGHSITLKEGTNPLNV